MSAVGLRLDVEFDPAGEPDEADIVARLAGPVAVSLVTFLSFAPEEGVDDLGVHLRALLGVLARDTAVDQYGLDAS